MWRGTVHLRQIRGPVLEPRQVSHLLVFLLINEYNNSRNKLIGLRCKPPVLMFDHDTLVVSRNPGPSELGTTPEQADRQLIMRECHW